MTDLEITRLCGKAMGLPLADTIRELADKCFYAESGRGNVKYDPLHNDSQVMALVKKLKIFIEPPLAGETEWGANIMDDVGAKSLFYAQEENLNAAICECVAKMTAALPARE